MFLWRKCERGMSYERITCLVQKKFDPSGAWTMPRTTEKVVLFMKRIISFVLTLILVCVLAVTAAAAEFSVNPNYNVIKAGEDVVVTVKLDESVPASDGTTAVQGELYYNADELTPVSITASDSYDYLTCVISKRNPRVQFNWFSDNGSPREFAAGTVVTAVFTAKEDMTVDHLTSTLELKMVMQNAQGQDVLRASSYGSVIVCREHTWNDGVVTTEATSLKAGVKTYTCTYDGCGAVRMEEIPASGEQPSDEDEDTTAPAPTEAGENTNEPNSTEAGEAPSSSTVSSESDPTVVDSATGHTWDEGQVTRAASCDKTGEKTYTCTECGETRTEEITAVGHVDANKDSVCDVCKYEMTAVQGGNHSVTMAVFALIILTVGAIVLLFVRKRHKNHPTQSE